MSLLLAASLANLSAFSLPGIPACALTQENVIFQFYSCKVATVFLISFIGYAWFLGFCRESSVTLVSVYTLAVRMFFFWDVRCCNGSSAFIMPICSAWLLEHLLSNLDVICVSILFPFYITVPEPTPSLLLLPSV